MLDREREHGQLCKGYYVDAPAFEYHIPGVYGVWGYLREAWGGRGEETWKATVWEYLGSIPTFGRRGEVEAKQGGEKDKGEEEIKGEEK